MTTKYNLWPIIKIEIFVEFIDKKKKVNKMSNMK